MSDQHAARLAGVLFILTFVTAIPAALLYDPVLDDTRWVVGDSEGHYVHVERIVGKTRELMLLGKFWEWQRAEEAVRAIQRKINSIG